MEDTGQRLTALSSMTLRGLVQKVNEKMIRHDDVVGVLRDNENFILLYYSCAH